MSESPYLSGKKLLPISFYQRDTVTVAKELLGKHMVYSKGSDILAGKVVETEAYLVGDPACHSIGGKTKRNEVMFGPSGFAYVFIIYGIHFCFNVTSGVDNRPEAVLIRALEPIKGIETMRRNRGQNEILNLCSGPGKLTQAMGIDMGYNGSSVVEGAIRFYESMEEDTFKVVTTTRVGISKAADWLLRFYIRDNEFISKK
ncbi:MAG: DNA-3-methyladenine glycosylase [Clostridia bacterium]|nr:DNA-3-methyladenine glycosylase [Clostridia bacterium]